eukprot:230248-Hanusia_phi.AAC.1
MEEAYFSRSASEVTQGRVCLVCGGGGVLFQLSDLSEIRKHVENADNPLGKFLSHMESFLSSMMVINAVSSLMVFKFLTTKQTGPGEKLMENGLEYYEKILSLSIPPENQTYG